MDLEAPEMANERRLPKNRPPTHPGEMLEKELLEPLGVSQSELARRIGVTFQTVNALVRGRRGVSPEMALRLEAAFGMSGEFWLNLQRSWDLWHAQKRMKAELAKIERIPAGV